MTDRNANRPGYKKTPVGWIPEEWGTSRLDSLAGISTGSKDTQDRQVDGEFPFFVRSQTVERINSYSYDGVAVLTAGDGVGTGKVFHYVDGKFDFHQRVYKVSDFSKHLHPRFFFHYFREHFLAQVITYTAKASVDSVRREMVAGMPIPLPPLPEQRKIAAILSTWDTAIDQTRALLAAARQRKKALMQQLLTGKRRLPGFEGEHRLRNTPLGRLPANWQLQQLETVFTPVRRKNTTKVALVLTASGENGLVDQRRYFTKTVAGEDQTRYYHLKRGEFAYNRSAMDGYPFGAIKRLDRYAEGILSTLYSCFALNNGQADSDFYTQFFETGLLNRQLRSIAHVGGRAHGLLNVTDCDFYAMQIPVPSLKEQRAIAAVLATADDGIRALESQVVALERQKKGLMQKLLTGEVRVKP